MRGKKAKKLRKIAGRLGRFRKIDPRLVYKKLKGRSQKFDIGGRK